MNDLVEGPLLVGLGPLPPSSVVKVVMCSRGGSASEA